MHPDDGMEVDVKQQYSNQTLNCCTVNSRDTVSIFGTGLRRADSGGRSGSLKALTVL